MTNTSIPQKLKLVTTALHVSAVFNFVVGACILTLSCFLFVIGFLQDDLGNFDQLLPGLLVLTMLFGSAGILFAEAAFIEFVVLRLKQGYYWSWVAALVLSIFNTFSILFVLGIIGIVGLVDHDVITFAKSHRPARRAEA